MTVLAFPEADRHFKRADGYQKLIIEKALPYCRAKRLAVDAGAHVGLLSRQMIVRGFERVVCFEPQSDNFACLRRNMDPLRSIAHRLALSDKAGTLSLVNPMPVNSGAWECRPYDGTAEPGEKIEAATLDSFGLAPDLIKYDVQGHEVKALLGSRATLETYRPVVIVECWRDGERDNGPRHVMEGLGANLVESCGKDLIFAWQESEA
jgi:FkbM family methyltransferase